ncbi:hypothetical protein HKX48_000114, partial [Thoreauomyces humboldtii]
MVVMRKRDAAFGLLKHARFTVTTALTLTILYTRSPHVLWCAMGGVLCSFIARGLKAIIRQPRPPTITEEVVEEDSPVVVKGEKPRRTRRVVKRVFASSVHGMPSSHTQVTSFFAAYAFLGLSVLPRS